MKRIITAFAAALIFFSASAQEGRRHVTTTFQGIEREYYISIPDSLAEGKPLILCLHGYGGSAEKYRPEMEQAALRHGYAICYPQGCKAPKGKTGWNVRYPKQEGMTTDDIAFMLQLAATIPAEYGLDSSNVFFSGMSNGGEMCYIMAYTHPYAFKAIASVAGLQMGWTLDELSPVGHVPFMEIHGTGDMTSRWNGDPGNEYGWGAYLAVPAAVANIVSMNACRSYSRTELPLLREEAILDEEGKVAKRASKPVILHRYANGAEGTEVLLYEVVGGSHSWALDDIDTCEEIVRFFDSYLTPSK